MADRYSLIVEGPNDKYVFEHLLKHYGIPEGRIEFRIKHGDSNLLDSLRNELRASDLQRVGIVLDADVDLMRRWQSLRSRLIQCGYDDVPRVPSPEGTIITRDDPPPPAVGIWLMPDNTMPGMLEHFVSFLGATGDPLWSIAEDCLNHIPQEHQRFIPNHRIKAHIHTWLAWQEEPGTPFGSAITKRYLNADALPAQQLMAWIRKLFDL